MLKGIGMLAELRVPIVSLVENMSFFTDPQGGVHHPFGLSQLESICAKAGLSMDAAFRLPIEQQAAVHSS